MKRIKLVLTFIPIISLLIFCNGTSDLELKNVTAETSPNPKSGFPKIETLVPHSPMTIDVDGDFIYWSFPGDGSPGNPFLIENYNITTTGQACLSFGGYTTLHFIVQNCFLKTDTYNAILLGKYQPMFNDTVHIYNNTLISKTEVALKINGSISGGKYVNNTGISFDAALELDDAPFSYVKGNTLIATEGIRVINSPSSSILHNFCINTTVAGISIIDSNDIIVVANRGPLLLDGCLDGRLEDNYAVDVDGGIEIQDSNFTYVTNNTVRATTAIRFTNSHGSYILNNVFIGNAEVGIDLTDSNHAVITGNNCSNNGYTGIVTRNSLNLSISYNILIENYYGIRMEGSSDSLITNNYFELNSHYGLIMVDSVGLSKIYHNAFYDNNFAGSKIQAYDNVGNQWYHELLLEGNFWNTWNPAVSSTYTIEGDAGSVDLYPLGDVPDIPEYTLNSIMILLSIISTAIAIIVVRFKRK